MKNIKIRTEVKQELEDFKEANELKSIHKAIETLLADAEEHIIPDFEGKPFININLEDEQLDKLKRCKLHRFETHSDTIHRLLAEYGNKK